MYNSEWADGSKEWTYDKLQQRDIPIDDRDGLFYVKVEDFVTALDSTFINYDTSNWHQGYFLMLDDPATKNGRDRKCGSACTRHKLIITSEVA